jgi:hypothetical protein
MPKKKGRDRPRSSDHKSTKDVPASVLHPLVIAVPNFVLTDAQVVELQRVGGVTISPRVRRRLDTLGSIWLSDLLERQSARPAEFRKRLDEISQALTEAKKAIRLSDLIDVGSDQPAPVSALDRHLLLWAVEAPVLRASSFYDDLLTLADQLSSVIGVVSALKKCLPADPGRPRPYGDERRLMSLADVFEEAGGVATAYASEAAPGGVANTRFRRFAQQFYSLLPADQKRTRAGLDDELRRALRGRRRRS